MRCTGNRTRLRFLQAIILAISIGTCAGGNEPAVRVVRVQGTRVHLRSGIPVHLDHANVTHHLTRGELFSVDRISYGPSATGDGMDGIWLHATSIRDPKVSGWICARYVAEVPGPNPALPPPSQPPIFIIPPPPSDPWLGLLNNILAIMNSLLSMLALFAPVLGVQWLFNKWTPAAATAVVAATADPTRVTNYIYGKGWWISPRG